MKFSVTVIFFLLFILVVAAYLYLVPEEELPAQRPPSLTMKLLPLEEDDEVVGIEIEDLENGESISLSRSREGWHLVYPVDYPADQLMAEGLVKALTLSSKARRLVPEKDWKEYGLDKPALKIGVETKRKPGMRTLLFGDASPVGNFIYGRWEGENEYFLLNADLKAAFERTAYSLREKRVFRMPIFAIEKVRLKTASGQYEILKRDGNWVWMEPIRLLGEEVGKVSMDEFLTQIRDLFIKEFPEETTRGYKEMGFSMSGSFIKITGKEESESEVLSLGGDLETKDAYYGKRKGESMPFLIARGNIRRLFETLETIAQGEMAK